MLTTPSFAARSGTLLVLCLASLAACDDDGLRAVQKCEKGDTCSTGFVCVVGVCRPTGGIACDDTQALCVAGYTCETGVCAGEGGAECSETIPCAAGLGCRDGRCAAGPGQACAGNNDVVCLEGLVCEDKVCLSGLGSPCDDAARKCATGTFCYDGTCRSPQRGPCSVNAECADGNVCLAGQCLGEIGTACVATSDCRTGTSCEEGLCRGRAGETCAAPDDCVASLTCEEGVCVGVVGSPCIDETGCGAGLTCAVGQCRVLEGGACALPSDCVAPLACIDNVCVQANCSDAQRNGTETDVDCGGACAKTCATGARCVAAADCESGVCTDGICIAPACTDRVSNGAETDVDCGGACPNRCTVGAHCAEARDCNGGACVDGICMAPTCSDGLSNGLEADLDCGVACGTPCATGARCVAAADCVEGVCADGVCVAPTCTDRVANGAETDIDCGGACPVPCTVGAHCAEARDCNGGACVGGVCRAPTCADGLFNGIESDLDCGAACDTRCATGARCVGAADCVSGVCTDGRCAPARCDDDVRNGTESDIDCGGSCPERCVTAQACVTSGDCVSQKCVANVCQAPTCSDHLRNGDESDVDCGGSCPASCDDARGCNIPEDCTSLVCTEGVCVTPACADGVRNGLEADVDCGIACPNQCATDRDCTTPADCQSGVCADGRCAAPTCTDGVHNGSESDLDCGAVCDERCGTDATCDSNDDCASRVCRGGYCTEPSCTDGVANGTETDVDCGGGCEANCVEGKRCLAGDDCISAVCTSRVCDKPTLGFAAPTQNVVEAFPTARARVVLTGAAGADVTVPFAVAGTATGAATGSGVDHRLVDGTLTIRKGSTEGIITAPLVDDTIFEDDETIVLTLGAATGANTGRAYTHTVKLLDDEQKPTIRFTATTTTAVHERRTTLTLTVAQTGASTVATEIPLTFEGTALEGADWEIADKTLTIPPGTSTASTVLYVVDDLVHERDETLTVGFGAVTGADVSEPSTWRLRIIENDLFKAGVEYGFRLGSERLAIGDFNGDKIPDVAAGSWNRVWFSHFLFTRMGVGDGTLGEPAEYELGDGVEGLATGDLNKDGRDDIAIATAHGVSVFHSTIGGILGPRNHLQLGGSGGGGSLAMMDLNGDDLLDIIAPFWGEIRVFTQAASGGFYGVGTVAGAPSRLVTVIPTDIGADGTRDIVYRNHLGSGFGYVPVSATGVAGSAVGLSGPASDEDLHITSVCDLNGDGKPDLVVPASRNGSFGTFVSNPAGFEIRVDYPAPGGVLPSSDCVDFNRDGYADVALASYNQQAVQMRTGRADGTLGEAFDVPAGGPVHFVTHADMNRDGLMDLVVNRQYGPVLIYLNNMTPVPAP